jgi:hypothetical protein
MNWIRRKLLNFLYPDEEVEAKSPRPARLTVSSDGHRFDDNNCLRFHVYNAQGGKIVQVYHYDRKRDENTTNLYVIENDEKFGENIGQIIFMEMLKKG